MLTSFKSLQPESGKFRQTVTTHLLTNIWGHRNGSSFRGGNKHQPSLRDSADGGRRAETTASGDSKARAVFRRNRGEETDKSTNVPQQVHHTDNIHHKNTSVLK